MESVVGDTCIFIDLIEIDLLNQFFELPFEFYTTDFVVNELTTPRHFSGIKRFIDLRNLKILKTAPDELYEIVQISERHPKLSISDCSVFYFGKTSSYTVLTNDKRLRELSKDIKVHGILWIFDCLVLKGIISKNQAIDKLNVLMGINQRLPLNECLKRIKEWSR